MGSRAYGEISAQCFERYGRWGAIYDHPRCLELWGLLAKLICHESSTMTGLAVVPLSSLVHGSVSEDVVRELMSILQAHDLVRWDERYNLVYLPGTIIDQMNLTTGRIKPRDNRLRSVRNQLSALERLIGQHEFISDLRARHLPEEEPNEESVKSGRGLPKPLTDSVPSGKSTSEAENSSEKGLSEGACLSPPAPASAPAPAPAPDLEVEGERGPGREGEDRPRTRSEQGMNIPGSQFEPGPGLTDYARDQLGLTPAEIDQTTEEYQDKNWLVVRYERQHALVWRKFARNIADRKASREIAANGGPRDGQEARGTATGGGVDPGRSGAESQAVRGTSGADEATGSGPRRLSERDARHRARSKKILAAAASHRSSGS